MSLEKALEDNTAALNALTAAIKAQGGTAKASTAAAAADAPAKSDAKPAESRGRGRPPKVKTAPEPEADDDLGDGLDEPDDDLGDGLDEPEDETPAYTFDDLKKMMVTLRDIGGDKANMADCKAIIAKFCDGGTFQALQGKESKFNEVADAIRKLAAKKKVVIQ